MNSYTWSSEQKIIWKMTHRYSYRRWSLLKQRRMVLHNHCLIITEMYFRIQLWSSCRCWIMRDRMNSNTHISSVKLKRWSKYFKTPTLLSILSHQRFSFSDILIGRRRIMESWHSWKKYYLTTWIRLTSLRRGKWIRKLL